MNSCLQHLFAGSALVVSLTVSFIGVAAGCSDTADDPGESSDVEPPTIDEVAATLGEPSPGTLDLASEDVRRIVVSPTPLTFRVAASDDVSATEDLRVRLVDPETNEAVASDDATFDRGLWRLETTARPGLAVTVRVRDAAGNDASWPHAAIFPRRRDALPREWSDLDYDQTGAVVDRGAVQWHDDGTWCAAAPTSTGGTWSVREGRLTIEHRHQTGCDGEPPPDEWETVERVENGPFYVDETYFSDWPLTSEQPGSSLEGRWSVEKKVGDRSAEAVLELGASEEFTRSDFDGGTVSGAYEVVENGGYEENFGDLLVFTIEQVDGAQVEPFTEVTFYVRRGDTLLIDPLVDTR